MTSTPLQSPWDANAWESDGGRNFWRKSEAASKGVIEASEQKASERAKPSSAHPKKQYGTNFPDRQPEK